MLNALPCHLLVKVPSALTKQPSNTSTANQRALAHLQSSGSTISLTVLPSRASSTTVRPHAVCATMQGGCESTGSKVVYVKGGGGCTTLRWPSLRFQVTNCPAAPLIMAPDCSLLGSENEIQVGRSTMQLDTAKMHCRAVLHSTMLPFARARSSSEQEGVAALQQMPHGSVSMDDAAGSSC